MLRGVPVNRPAPPAPHRPRPAARTAARLLAGAVLLAAGAGGCATLRHGHDQPVRIDSEPAGAQVEVDGEPVGHTPCVVALARAHNHTVRVTADGRQPAGVTLYRNLSPWAWANVANLALPGMLVDAATGALYDLTPDAVHLTLSPEP